jgi:phosphoribosyl 1,2-cyclic phosphodiesterase/CheY-like chemotaxis protein
MNVRFWGTRGSIAKPGPSTIRYGGNTSCVEIRSAAGTLVVIDCGTGAHELGKMLTETEARPLRGHMLISHTHWDHIQGWPFFAPLFVPGNEWDIYAPHGLAETVQETLAGQMQYTYFPVLLEQLSATIRYHELVEGVFSIGDIKIKTQYLNHPALTLGYRLEADGATVVYACDHEPYSRQMAIGLGEPNRQDQWHVDFLAGADLVIHDAQYTVSEYQEKIGWGHSTAEYAVEIGRIAGVKAIALTHHDPLRDDDGIDKLIEMLRGSLVGKVGVPRVFAAAEGPILELDPAIGRPMEPEGEQHSALSPVSPNLSDHLVILGISDRALAGLLVGVVKAEGIRVRLVADGASAVQAALSDRPSLVVLEQNLSGMKGLDACRAIRMTADTHAKEVPIVIVSTEEDAVAGAAAGVSSWLLRPFSSIYARTRLRAGVLRLR